MLLLFRSSSTARTLPLELILLFYYPLSRQVFLFIFYSGRSKTDMKQAYESRHTQVQDFDWVRGGQSPNWSLLSKDQASTLFTQEMASRLYDEGINVREKEKGEHMAMEWTERLIELSALHPS